MLIAPFRRPGRLRRLWSRLLLFLVSVVLCIDFFLNVAFNAPSIRVPSSSTAPADSSKPRKERIFIASMNWNNEFIIRTHWGAALLSLVDHFGADNVYISISESGSFDNTTGALRDLDAELEVRGVRRSIEIVETMHKNETERIPEPDERGWIQTSRGKKELRRIPYLAGIRNRVMEKMFESRERFDKILWLNDVIFETEDVTTLMATRDGDYAAVCSLDFAKPPIYYDTFALRDGWGAKAITLTWPFFFAEESRKAMMSNSPVRVKSCWNGIVVFQADPFYGDPLNFRGLPDSLAEQHLEGSECCLIHADNELSAQKGVWLNPNVRVGYNQAAYNLVNPPSGIWPNKKEKLMGIWGNRWARWTLFPQRYAERYAVGRRIQSWRSKVEGDEADKFHINDTHCIVNEMQVLTYKGWAHV